MLNIGTTNISNLYVGSAEVDRVYLGTDIVYEKQMPVVDAVKFTALQNNSSVGLSSISSNQSMQYSTNGRQWSTFDTGVTISLNSGGSVYVRGTLSADNTDSDYTNFTMSGSIKASGNVNTLWNYQNPSAVLKAYCGFRLFNGCASLVDIDDIELPSMDLASHCYYRLFYNCGMTSVPEDLLPATLMKPYCYAGLFYECLNLLEAPDLPATALDDYCYWGMFDKCASLTTVPELSATILAPYCYLGMFQYCTNLTDVPNSLSATTLANNCYAYMFFNCTSLTSAPELPATTLADSCYFFMFSHCTSLTTAPELPATTIVPHCYENMFDGCTSLRYIKCLTTDITPTNCTDHWVRNVASSGTFVKHPDATNWTTGVNGIPTNWIVEDYLPAVKFTAQEANSTIGLEKLSTNQTLEYSTDLSTWSAMTTATTITLANSGDTVYVRGVLSGNNTYNNYTQFKMTGEIAASGNCNYLWNHNNPDAPLEQYCGYHMFYGCTSLTTAPELPATMLANNCYKNMFEGCTSLTTAPSILPSTTLADTCYGGMFQGCTSLTTAPELPATTLADTCYGGMFQGCTSLTTAPVLPATTLPSSCYQNMFAACASLSTTPELPATTLAFYCCAFMFSGCTSLTTAPSILPATTLASYCYQYMFYRCRSLTAAPELPATSLNDYCYWGMFYDCTGLTTAPELPATILTNSCYYSMFYNCRSLNYIKCLAVNGINQNNSTTSWVQGVASSGTFVKHPEATSWTTGANGIPTNWTVEDAQ